MPANPYAPFNEIDYSMVKNTCNFSKIRLELAFCKCLCRAAPWFSPNIFDFILMRYGRGSMRWQFSMADLMTVEKAWANTAGAWLGGFARRPAADRVGGADAMAGLDRRGRARHFEERSFRPSRLDRR
ncbi:MAG: hypothetical protein GVY28_10850 [Alphaproteobacteria bacterium]|nr:hypothetical protein [Alphaproteobacteria bacterium]